MGRLSVLLLGAGFVARGGGSYVVSLLVVEAEVVEVEVEEDSGGELGAVPVCFVSARKGWICS